MQDKVFAAGGQNTKSEFVSEMRCYDTLSANWLIARNTNPKMGCHLIVTI